jgi:hypothetical protein
VWDEFNLVGVVTIVDMLAVQESCASDCSGRVFTNLLASGRQMSSTRQDTSFSVRVHNSERRRQ